LIFCEGAEIKPEDIDIHEKSEAEKKTVSEIDNGDILGGSAAPEVRSVGGAQERCATKWERDLRQNHNGVPPTESNGFYQGKGGRGKEDAVSEESSGKCAPLQSLEEIEKAAILSAIARCGGNRTKAAEELGITRKTIQNKMKSYGL
jgi:DNA-binding NtrC family response regulator